MSAFILFNQKKSNELGLRMLGVPVVSVPQMRYNEINIPGRDGVLYEERGYDDLKVEINFEILDKEEILKNYKNISLWLLNFTENSLVSWLDETIYYRVHKVVVSDYEGIYRDIGKFTVNFVCDPYRYYQSGKDPLSIPASINNTGVLCKPIYQLKGAGDITLTVNGKSAIFDLHGYAVNIDTDRMIMYKDNSGEDEMQPDMTGNYEDLWLKAGNNTISVSGGDGSSSVIPHFRTL